MSSAPRQLEDEALALELAGLRFRDRDTEADFRGWFALEAQPYARLAFEASVVGWLIGWLALGLTTPGAFGPTTAVVLGAVVPLLAIALWATFHPNYRMLVICGLINMSAGVIAIWPLSYDTLDSPEAASSVVVVFGYFAFTIFRLPPSIAGSGVFVYAVLNQVLLFHAHSEGRLNLQELWIESVIPWIAFLTGLLACCVLSVLSREAYRREQVIERQQHVIAAEQARADALLRNVLPDQVAERLKDSDEPIADFFAEVTVLFADIVGFTVLAHEVQPRDLVTALNEVFSRFDALTAARGAEKIKTVGDAYMAVAGVPQPRADHVATMADLALDMRDAMADLDQRTGLALRCRLGLATGPAVAGVIGQKRFAYDLWGHTVNMAARMESHGIPGQIQVTAEVHERLADTFDFEARGPVDIKGVGAMDTWLLLGRTKTQPELFPAAETTLHSVSD